MDFCGLDAALSDSLASLAIQAPSPVQAACIPEVLAGKDVLAVAPPGSGKTIAFAAPLVERWSRDPSAMYALVLTPTRELALQIDEQLRALGAGVALTTTLAVGGQDRIAQSLEMLQIRPSILIATPGRMADHIETSSEIAAMMRRTKVLVLDEADRLLDDAFAEPMKTIMDAVSPKNERQTLLFTATMNNVLAKIKQSKPADELFSYEEDPSKPLDKISYNRTQTGVTITGPSTRYLDLDQRYVLVPSHVKIAYLAAVLSQPQFDNTSVIVFVNRSSTANSLGRTLDRIGLGNIISYHSKLAQRERVASLHKFRTGSAKKNVRNTLIATDLASRGLDIPFVDCVINFDLPRSLDTYIHRCGRVHHHRDNRLDNSDGLCINFTTEHEVELFKAIELFINNTMDRASIPQNDKSETWKMNEWPVSENKVIEALKQVAKARREVILEMELQAQQQKRVSRKRKSQ